MTDYRTHVGDVLRDSSTGRPRYVVAVYRAEDLDKFIDGRCYLRRPDERSALHGGGRRRGAKAAQ